MERLLDLSARFRHELPDGTRRKLLAEAIEIGERLASPLSLAKASQYAGDFWWEKKSYDLAEQYFERSRSLLETDKSSHGEAAKLWTSLGVSLYHTHASALWWARSRSRHAEATRHYEGMAKYVIYLRPPDPDDDSIDSVPLTRREYLERAATAYQTAGPEFSGDLGRVRRQIQTEFGNGPFR